MSVWDSIAEARIREWLQRPAAEREASSVPLEPGLPLEVQLLQDIAQLDRMEAASTDAAEAAVLHRKASELMLRLMVVLESEGRPLAAKHFAEQRQQMRDQNRSSS
jgi:hypothetical protein